MRPLVLCVFLHVRWFTDYYGIIFTLFIARDADSWRMRRGLRRAA